MRKDQPGGSMKRIKDLSKNNIFEYIETYHNRSLKHSVLDYHSPAQFDNQLNRKIFRIRIFE